MASTAVIVNEIMAEFGKSDSHTAARIEQKVGDIVIDLLSQNKGRFKGLEKTQTISILEDEREYRLSPDFNTAKQTFYEVDDDGNFKNECMVVTKGDVHRRSSEGELINSRMGYIKFFDTHTSGRGIYLVLATDPGEATIYEFDYYRKPTRKDTDLIRTPETIKLGTRGSFPALNQKAEYDLAVYERRKQGFKESPEKYKPKMSIKPTRKTSRFNRSMRNIGKGC